MKRVLAIVLVLCMALVGCGDNSTQDNASSGSTDDSSKASSAESGGTEDEQATEPEMNESYDPITIQFWNGWTGSDGQVLLEYVEKFNETNKWNITVEMDISSEFGDKITTAMAADASPALILTGASGKYDYEGKVRCLDDIWEKTDMKEEDFISSYLDSLSTEEGLYGIPFQIASYVMYSYFPYSNNP